MTYLSGRVEKQRRMVRYSVYIVLLFCLVFFWSDVKKVAYPFAQPFITRYATWKQIIGAGPKFFSTYITTREAILKKDSDLMVTIERLENQIAEKDSQLKELHSIVDDTGTSTVSTTLVMYPLMQDMTKMYGIPQHYFGQMLVQSAIEIQAFVVSNGAMWEL